MRMPYSSMLLNKPECTIYSSNLLRKNEEYEMPLSSLSLPWRQGVGEEAGSHKNRDYMGLVKGERTPAGGSRVAGKIPV